jgi:hypothetical protein
MRNALAVLLCSFLVAGQVPDAAAWEMKEKVAKIRFGSEIEVVRKDGTKLRGTKGWRPVGDVAINPGGNKPIVGLSFSETQSLRRIRHPFHDFFTNVGYAIGFVFSLPEFLVMLIGCGTCDQ